MMAEAPKSERKIDFTDFTTPIPRNKQLVAHRRGRLVLGLFGVGFALAIGAALFVLPVKSWLRQSDELRTRTSEVDTLNNANDQLQREVDRLQTDAGIKEAARTQLDYVEAGEHRITILPSTKPITALPATWPYNLVVQIVSLRSQEATAATATTAPPVPTTVAAAAGPSTAGTGVTASVPATVPGSVPTSTSVATMVSTAAPPVPSAP